MLDLLHWLEPVSGFPRKARMNVLLANLLATGVGQVAVGAIAAPGSRQQLGVTAGGAPVLLAESIVTPACCTELPFLPKAGAYCLCTGQFIGPLGWTSILCKRPLEPRAWASPFGKPGHGPWLPQTLALCKLQLGSA